MTFFDHLNHRRRVYRTSLKSYFYCIVLLWNYFVHDLIKKPKINLKKLKKLKDSYVIYCIKISG